MLFPNLRGYDVHLIVNVLKKQHGKTRVIANHMETYMSFSPGQLQFLDSFQFTNRPLEKLVETLSSEEFAYTSEGFPNSNEFALVKQKGVYMYDYINSMERFHKTYLTYILVGSSINMRNVYGTSSSAKLWKTTTISILKVMSFCLRTSSKNFAILVSTITAWIQYIIIALLD